MRKKAISMIQMVLAIHPEDAEASRFLTKLNGKKRTREPNRSMK
jgi:hypothetical protein